VALYFTSDHHFGHRNIIGYAGRPFPSLERMHEYLVEVWNDEVDDDDDVWFLGDVALGQIDESLQHISRLKGRKVLLPGNHDRCFSGHKKAESERQRYLDAGFEAILDDPQMLTIANRDVTISHFPYRNTGVLDEHTVRYTEHRPVDEGGWLLHGHVHERWRVRGRQINVGVDAWAGHPVSLEKILYYVGPDRLLDIDPYLWPKSAGMEAEELAAYSEHVRKVTGRQLRHALGVHDF
jgi:calcineurin-like phosphoesterase family protein